MSICSLTLSRIAITVLAAFLLLTGPPAKTAAQNDKSWKVVGKILGETRQVGLVGSPDDAKKSEDVSGLACAAGALPRICMIVDDESQGAQVVILKDGEIEAGDFIHLIDHSFDGDPLELDAEGVAYADGAFYVIGSHGRPRHETGKKEEKNVARSHATRKVFRITFEPNSVDKGSGKITIAPQVTGSVALAGRIKDHPRLKEWFDKALEDNGLTVEGIAAKDGKLYVGMRGPVLDDGNAIVLEAPISMVFDGKSGDITVHELDLGKDTEGGPRGIRDIVSHIDGFLILAGPVNDPPDENYKIRKGDYTVFAWSGKGSVDKNGHDLDGYGVQVKPEAIVPLEDTPRNFQLLVLFDGPDEGRPTPVQVQLK